MLIRVIPTPPFPTVLFTITFPNLPPDLPFPPYWDVQLQRLSAEELEVPQSVHALDKSAWIAALLVEVTFDMTSLTATALFVDHSVEEWPLMGQGCVSALESVLADVNLSADESEREKERSAAGSQSPVPLPAPAQAKPIKHRKQRSLLMSLVASLVPSSNSAPPPPPPVQAPPPPPVPPVVTAVRAMSARVLRRRARSTLVDAYRRYVVTELKTRLHPSGFSIWIVSSMLRRATEHMTWLVQQAGGVVPDLRQYAQFSSSQSLLSSPAATLMPSPLDDDDEEGGELRSLADTNSTDTDGSSIHTPTHTPLVHRTHRFDHACQVPRSPSPDMYSPEDLETYAALHNQSLHLRRLLVHMDVMQKNIALEERQLHSVLEIKSKRRAWSNRVYKGRAEMSELGLAMPFRSSPLARFEPITRGSLTSSFQYLSIRTMDDDLSCLFPVPESDEEEDLEAGLTVPTFAPAAYRTGITPNQGATLELPRIRARTRSIHRLQALDLDPTLSPDPPVLIVPPPSSASPCTSATMHSVPALVAPVPVAAHHKARFDAEFDMALGKETTEFTLAMDVQFKAPQRTYEYDRDEWLPRVMVDFRVAQQPPPFLELDPTLLRLKSDETEFFKSVTGIRDEAVLREHILTVQREAYDASSSDGSFRTARYGLSRLRVGADMRKAVLDGWPESQTIATDIVPEFWALGHKLFRSTETTFPVPFLPGDVFDPNHLGIVAPSEAVPISAPPLIQKITSLNPLHGHVAVIHAAAIFHLFSQDKQLALARALAGLLSSLPGSSIFGWNTGKDEAGFVDFEGGVSHPRQFCHSPRSWTEMWDGEVFRKGTVEVVAQNVVFSEDIGLKLKGGAVLKKMEWMVTRL
ncbi:hypothetical protein EW146_g4390 [Bondarzewia mesenterica]|uniref:Uncharacterized protein n=1 Tax=Bondarzewia mesenterica TaxID=1095465 RepID=A0A4S4LWX1_9AGAM|nr:hypothetical protein EW146_g4390 [Bondarzewia mesenterica]